MIPKSIIFIVLSMLLAGSSIAQDSNLCVPRSDTSENVLLKCPTYSVKKDISCLGKGKIRFYNNSKYKVEVSYADSDYLIRPHHYTSWIACGSGNIEDDCIPHWLHHSFKVEWVGKTNPDTSKPFRFDHPKKLIVTFNLIYNKKRTYKPISWPIVLMRELYPKD